MKTNKHIQLEGDTHFKSDTEVNMPKMKDRLDLNFSSSI